MPAAMPRIRKPYVNREVTRHGKTVWYFRKGDGPRIRLRGDYESREWLEDYDAALNGLAPAERPRASSGTLGWLIDRYFDSVAFAKLAPGTQRMRRNILKHVKAKAGHWTLSQVTRKKIAESRDARSATPAAAATYVRTMKSMLAWAVEAQHIAENPADGVSGRDPKTDGHHTWTIQEVRAYQKRHPIGTMARLALDILLYTGMRRGDAVVFGRQHVRDGWIHYRSEKTRVEVDMPLLEPLRHSIEASATKTELTFLTTAFGSPFKSSASFGNWFEERCIEAGVPGRAHGLRKAGATIAGENGASDLMLMAYWGWTDPKQAAVYTRKAHRGRLAQAASTFLVLDEERTSIPAPDNPVRGNERIV